MHRVLKMLKLSSALCETTVIRIALTLQGSVLSSGSIRFQCQLLNPEMCCGQRNTSSQDAVFPGGMQICTQRVVFAWSSSWSFCLMRQNNTITALSNKHISCPTCSEDLHLFPLSVSHGLLPLQSSVFYSRESVPVCRIHSFV